MLKDAPERVTITAPHPSSGRETWAWSGRPAEAPDPILLEVPQVLMRVCQGALMESSVDAYLLDDPPPFVGVLPYPGLLRIAKKRPLHSSVSPETGFGFLAPESQKERALLLVDEGKTRAWWGRIEEESGCVRVAPVDVGRLTVRTAPDSEPVGPEPNMVRISDGDIEIGMPLDAERQWSGLLPTGLYRLQVRCEGFFDTEEFVEVRREAHTECDLNLIVRRDTFRVAGQVWSDSGSQVEGASVSLRSTDSRASVQGGTISWQELDGALRGSYEFPFVPPGSYDLVVEGGWKFEWAPSSQRITGATEDADFRYTDGGPGTWVALRLVGLEESTLQGNLNVHFQWCRKQGPILRGFRRIDVEPLESNLWSIGRIALDRGPLNLRVSHAHGPLRTFDSSPR